MRGMRRTLFATLFVLMLARSGFAQLSPSASWATHFSNEYRMIPNVTYLTASNVDLKLDVYQRQGVATPQPTVIYMHGGFWVAGNKESAITSIMPWIEMGWNVVNVEYRLGQVAQAPAALEDCLCALKFVAAQARMYNVDVNRIVVTGESAGGHLALALGVLPVSLGLDRECANNTPLPRVAAVVNWYGITDAGCDRWSTRGGRGHAVVWRDAESAGGRQAGFADQLRARRSASDHHDSRRR